ncbi:hypothetical protein D3C84_1220130 [compost metagenome]
MLSHILWNLLFGPRQRKQIGITAGHHPARRVEALVVHPRGQRIVGLSPMELHSPNHQAARIRDLKRRCTGMRV